MRPSASGRSETSAWLPVVACFALVVALSSIPGDDMPVDLLFGTDKLVHFGEYAILGVLLVRAFVRGPSRWSAGRAALAAVVCAVLFGVSDEWHQAFVPGRSPSAMDAVADGLGAVLGAGAAWLHYRRRS